MGALACPPGRLKLTSSAVGAACPIVFASWVLCLAFLLPLPAAFAAEQEDEPSAQLAEIAAAIGQIEEWLVTANAQQSSEEKALQAAQQEIDELNQAAALITQNLETLIEQALVLESRRLELQQATEQNSRLLGSTLRAQYVAGNDASLKLLLNGEDLSRQERMAEYYRHIDLAIVSQIESYRQLQRELELVAVELQENSEQTQNEQAAMNLWLTELELARVERNEALNLLQASIAAKGSELSQLRSNRAELQRLVEEVNQAILDIPSPQDLAPFEGLKGQLSKPVSSDIASNFGASYGNGSLRRQGIIFATQEGEEVRSVHGGRVVFADWLRGSGLLIILDHGEGYLSLYGSNQSLTRTAGQWVESGEVLALASGGDDSSTGLYFEIRHNGEALNPESWWR